MAVGSATASGRPVQRAFALVWTGDAWSDTIVPSPPGDTVLNGVACPRTGACVAVGYAKDDELPQALVERWDGQRWSVDAAARPIGSLESLLSAVACQSPASCVAVGSSSTSGDHDDPVSTTLAERWNGSAWSVEHTPTPGSGNLGTLASVACTHACFAVGNFSQTNNAYADDTQALVESDDTGVWATMTGAGLATSSQSALQSVACPAAGQCAAIGSAPSASYGAANPLLETWENGAWSRGSLQLPGAVLESIACPTVSLCLAVGERDGGTSAVAVWVHPSAEAGRATR